MIKYLKIIFIILLSIFVTSCGSNNTAGIVGTYNIESGNIIKNYFGSKNKINLQSIETDNIKELLSNNYLKSVLVDEYFATYFTNDDSKFQSIPHKSLKLGYSFCFNNDYASLANSINIIIDELNEENFFDDINNYYLIDNINQKFGYMELPYFENTDTFKIAVCGDLPPLDYAKDIDGKTYLCGYSFKIINEISKRLNINFEIVRINKCDIDYAMKKKLIDGAYLIRYFNDKINDAPIGCVITKPFINLSMSELILGN